MSTSTKSGCRWLALTLVLAGIFTVSSSQRIVNIPQGVGTLNNTILGDTTAQGARVDLNTVYVLQRGGLYLTTVELNNTFPLHIEAAAGTGARPIIQPAVLSGGVANRPFRPRKHLTLKGVYVTNRDELGGLLTNIIRVSADSVRLVLEDTHLDQDGQSAIRTDNAAAVVILKNSIVSNIGTMGAPDNGRAVDDRGVALDTVIMENCTFYNLTSRVYRDGGGLTKYLRFNHNTVVNIAQHGTTFGPVKDLIVTNNLFVNAGFLGNTPVQTRNIVGVDSILGQTQTVLIRNNNFFTNWVVKDAQPDTVTPLPFFNATAQEFVTSAGYDGTIKSDSVTFTKGPAIPTSVLAAYSWTSSTGSVNIDTSGSPHNFAYATSFPSYSGSTAGQPLGALTWFGMTISPTSVNEVEFLPEAFDLEQNFPNPFNPETSIRYRLSGVSRVVLSIYNLLGQEINRLVSAQQAAGTYTVQWNGTTNLGTKAASGVYLYRLSVDGSSLTRAMVLQK